MPIPMRRTGRLPDFIGIGSRQSATSWLYAHLARHPDVFVSETKELRYWDGRYKDHPLEAYTRHFPAGERRVAGEITPRYCAMSTESIEHLHEHVPHGRLIYILRNPALREWSNMRRFMRRKGRDTSSSAIPELLRTVDEIGVRAVGDHGTNLARWRAVYPSEQLLTVDFRSIADEPAAVLDDIAVHLGVEPFPDETSTETKVNSNGPTDIPDEVLDALLRIHEPVFRSLEQEMPDVVRRWRRGEE